MDYNTNLSKLLNNLNNLNKTNKNNKETKKETKQESLFSNNQNKQETNDLYNGAIVLSPKDNTKNDVPNNKSSNNNVNSSLSNLLKNLSNQTSNTKAASNTTVNSNTNTSSAKANTQNNTANTTPKVNPVNITGQTTNNQVTNNTPQNNTSSQNTNVNSSLSILLNTISNNKPLISGRNNTNTSSAAANTPNNTANTTPKVNPVNITGQTTNNQPVNNTSQNNTNSQKTNSNSSISGLLNTLSNNKPSTNVVNNTSNSSAVNGQNTVQPNNNSKTKEQYLNDLKTYLKNNNILTSAQIANITNITYKNNNQINTFNAASKKYAVIYDSSNKIQNVVDITTPTGINSVKNVKPVQGVQAVTECEEGKNLKSVSNQLTEMTKVDFSVDYSDASGIFIKSMMKTVHGSLSAISNMCNTVAHDLNLHSLSNTNDDKYQIQKNAYGKITSFVYGGEKFEIEYNNSSDKISKVKTSQIEFGITYNSQNKIDKMNIKASADVGNGPANFDINFKVDNNMKITSTDVKETYTNESTSITANMSIDKNLDITAWSLNGIADDGTPWTGSLDTTTGIFKLNGYAKDGFSTLTYIVNKTAKAIDYPDFPQGRMISGEGTGYDGNYGKFYCKYSGDQMLSLNWKDNAPMSSESFAEAIAANVISYPQESGYDYSVVPGNLLWSQWSQITSENVPITDPYNTAIVNQYGGMGTKKNPAEGYDFSQQFSGGYAGKVTTTRNSDGTKTTTHTDADGNVYKVDEYDSQGKLVKETETISQKRQQVTYYDSKTGQMTGWDWIDTNANGSSTTTHYGTGSSSNYSVTEKNAQGVITSSTLYQSDSVTATAYKNGKPDYSTVYDKSNNITGYKSYYYENNGNVTTYNRDKNKVLQTSDTYNSSKKEGNITTWKNNEVSAIQLYTVSNSGEIIYGKKYVY